MSPSSITFKEFLTLLRVTLNKTGTVISEQVRDEENPPSAAFHMTLIGKEYLITVQPTDLARVEEE